MCVIPVNISWYILCEFGVHYKENNKKCYKFWARFAKHTYMKTET